MEKYHSIETWLGKVKLEPDMCLPMTISKLDSGWELRGTPNTVEFLVTIHKVHKELRAIVDLKVDEWNHLCGVVDMEHKMAYLYVNSIEKTRDNISVNLTRTWPVTVQRRAIMKNNNNN